jgi:hypothetical protein
MSELITSEIQNSVCNKGVNVTSEVLKVALMKIHVMWDVQVIPRSLVNSY